MSKHIFKIDTYDTHAEIPASGKEGQVIFCKACNEIHYRLNSTIEIPNYAAPHDHPYSLDSHTHEGGSHPDLATHLSMGLEEAGTYAASSHNHDSSYEIGRAHV